MTLKISIRWKLVIVLVGTLSILFALVMVWVLSFTTDMATRRLEEQLHDSAIGGAAVIDGDAFRKLTELAAVHDPDSDSGLGYPDDPLYEQSARSLWDLRSVVPAASPYTYFRDPADGELYFASSYGYFTQPRFGVPFRMPVADVANATSYERMAQGLVTPTDQPAYHDEYGSWISTYAPIHDSQGRIVGAIGVDYPLEYVEQVREGVTRHLYLMFAAIYAIALLLVLLITRGIVRPLNRLTSASKRLADGEYDLDIAALAKVRFPDEMSELARSFSDMAGKVERREQSLTTELERLRVEIDEHSRTESVREIVETDFFSELASKADEMRAKMRPGQS